jgi:hypothetical protein
MYSRRMVCVRGYPPPVFKGLSLRAIVLAGLALVVFTSCSGESRPSVEEWHPTWEAVVGSFPSASTLGTPPDHAVCSHALGVLRSTSGDLSPTPDLAIDDVVAEWLQIAENALYECPPSSQTIPSLEYAYGELARLQAEVDVVLVIDAGDG